MATAPAHPFLRRHRTLIANVRYFAALARRFRVTLTATLVLFAVIPWIYVFAYVAPDGGHIGFGEAFNHVYFLLFGQPSLPFVNIFLIEVLNVTIPPLGVAVVADGIVRLALLAWAREHQDKEWIAVMTRAFDNHVIVCGAGRTGYRVAQMIAELGQDVVIVERKEDGPFVGVLRDQGLPVLIDDIRSRGCLQRMNVEHARTIVAATDDDLANLNVALDARRLNPGIKVVMRLFDDDLAATVRDTIKAETFSTTAVAAPAIALAAIDPRIDHSFRVGAHLMVVSEFTAATVLATMTVSEIRDKYGGLVVAHRRDGVEKLHPAGHTTISRGDVLVIQASYGDYTALRAFIGEAMG